MNTECTVYLDQYGYALWVDATAASDAYAVIIGVNDRAEIWSADVWRAQEEEDMTPEKMAACMAELGF